VQEIRGGRKEGPDMKSAKRKLIERLRGKYKGLGLLKRLIEERASEREREEARAARWKRPEDSK
jgi:hypothetical protein